MSSDIPTQTAQPLQDNLYDVVIIGGSYAGLSAAMALGRALRNVLIIDSGLPCNRNTPHSHNFLTRDGSTPAALAAVALEQVLAYPTITLCRELGLKTEQSAEGFLTTTTSGAQYRSRKLILATGIKDLMPEIAGLSDCWGISVIHCPYCHGYEYHGKPTAILANGDTAYELGKQLSNWTKKLYLLTNGAATLSEEQGTVFQQLGIEIIEQPVAQLQHTDGYLQEIVFDNASPLTVPVMYARLPFEQHSSIAADLGCQYTQQGHVQVDAMQMTTVAGVYACGDNSSGMRSVAQAVYAGTLAGAALNRELTEEAIMMMAK